MRKHREFLAPDLTPLIDIVFLLLIFFLVTSVFKKEDFALLLNLPKTAYATQNVNTNEVDILISVDKFAVDEKIVDITTLDQRLASITDKEQSINVRIDSEVKYDRIIVVLDLLKKHNLANLALISNKDANK